MSVSQKIARVQSRLMGTDWSDLPARLWTRGQRNLARRGIRFAKNSREEQPAPICSNMLGWLRAHPEIARTTIKAPEGYLRPLPRSVEPTIEPRFIQALWGELAEFFVAPIPRAIVRGNNGVIQLPDGQYPSEVTFFSAALLRQEYGYRKPIARIEKKRGDYFVVPLLWWNNYGHWIVDILSRLYLAKPHLPATVKYIVPGSIDADRLKMLELIGISKQQIEFIDWNDAWQVERLWYAPPAAKTRCHPMQVPRCVAQAMRDALDVYPKRFDRRIYISRRNFKTRRMVNELQVEACLNEHGFETFIPGTLTLREEITLFAEAEILIENTGAGLANCIFAKSGAAVIDMFESHHFNLYHWSLCSALQQSYWYFFVEPATDPQHQHPDIFVPIDKLRETLHRVIDRAPTALDLK